MKDNTRAALLKNFGRPVNEALDVPAYPEQESEFQILTSQIM